MFSRLPLFRRGSAVLGVSAGIYVATWQNTRTGLSKIHVASSSLSVEAFKQPLPARESLVDSLKDEQFDVLVIGGGSAGAGVVLDAQTRGLKSAMVEYGDYCCGTSSKSSKLLHGGVKYLETALKELDWEQYRIVQEGLDERKNVMKAAPYLSRTFPVLVPTYKWWQSVYYWGGVKLYDFLAGKGVLKPSRFVSKEEALEICPTIRKEGLRGAILYYDGQQNDARLVLAVALTAIRNGAKCVNHTECVDLLKDSNGKVCGALVRDHITNETYKIHAKTVVNATGPFNDHIRKMADEDRKPMILGSSGIHLTIAKYFCPGKTGLINPKSSDGRVIFAFPWEDFTIVGTTDDQATPTHAPTVSEKEIQYILKEMNRSFEKEWQIRREDVTSVWSGIRGLVLDPRKKDHKTLARTHLINVGPSNLITIAGGKLTTFRHMAEQTVDKLVEVHKLQDQAAPCATRGMMFEGGHEYSPMLYRSLAQKYGLEEQVATHLCQTYGDKALEVVKLCKSTGKKFPAIGHRLHPDFPFLEAEVRYAVKEYARIPADILARRTRLSLLNARAAREVLPRVVAIMAEELGWSEVEQKRQYEAAMKFLRVEMGLSKLGRGEKKVELTSSEKSEIAQKFRHLDKEQRGHFTSGDLQHFLTQTNPSEKLATALVEDVLLEASGGNYYVSRIDLEDIYLKSKSGSFKGRRLIDHLGDLGESTL
ncbi:unnamed protein product [Caenorhabditis sp. 36 PRJEB53466]|nr:unnamed protein product [Caenorhabditis sp. 36 PRJEB53466]